MLVLDGYENYESAEFQKYCKIYNIITFRLLLYLSHLTQPLDVGFFNMLKRAYNRQIETFSKAYINYITNIEFFLAFAAVYKELIIVQNAQTGFRKAGLVFFDLQTVISKLNIKLQTLIPFRPLSPVATLESPKPLSTQQKLFYKQLLYKIGLTVTKKTC